MQGFDCKINSLALGGALLHATGQTGKHKHKAFPSQLQSLGAATCSLKEKVLPLLLY